MPHINFKQSTTPPHPHPPKKHKKLAEYRISVYGRKPVEWDTLAAWVVQNRLYSDNNVWLIQVGVAGGGIVWVGWVGGDGCGVWGAGSLVTRAHAFLAVVQ